MQTAFKVGEVCGLLKAAMFLLDHNGQPYQRVGEALKLFEIVSENLLQDYIRSRADMGKVNVLAQSKLLNAISELVTSDPSAPVMVIITSAADHILRL